MAVIPKRVYHKPRGRKYAYGSTANAIRRAHRKGYDAIDLDMTVDADGNRWCNHWQALMWKDAWRLPGRRRDRRRIADLPTSTVRRLRSPWGKILSAHAALMLCKRLGMQACFEVKPDPKGRVYTVAWWRTFRRLCNTWGVDPIIMSLPMGTHGPRALKAAHDAGFRTMWLYRRGSVRPSFVDYEKSRPGHPRPHAV